ncbi:hypothetical protein FA15DRAFT_594150 [Coprinopsis marcescibilis]|uniref:Uncharacterized protein n=1 Tax=Coprinopsis marcescibilis TaxID=230819 RepID=A0A5C3L5H7_COPMA|nr:hypothetical protein FA15DRAFT_594150 [Coprinopsis marcescibilis]
MISGIQCFMCLYGLSAFLDSPRESRKGRIPYVIASFLIFATYCLAATLDLYGIFGTLLRVSSGVDVLLNIAESQPDFRKYFVLSCFTVLLLIGDGLLLYRCYIVLDSRRWFLILPTFTYVGVIGMQTYLVIPTEAAFIGLSVVTNVSITTMITYRLLKAQRHLAKTLPSKDVKIYSGIASILVESAMPLMVSGLGSFATTFALIPSTLSVEQFSTILPVNGMFATLYYAFVAISPQMIIFRVATGRSWTRSPSELSGPNLSGPLVFARNSRNLTESAVDRTQCSNGESTPQQSSHLASNVGANVKD